MKQKVIIGFSILLLLLAVFLIARDLFRHSPSFTTTACCGEEDKALKEFDTTLIGYNRIGFFDTGLKNLSGINVDGNSRVFVCGNRQVAVYDPTGTKIQEFNIDTTSSCITVKDTNIYIGTGSHIACYDLNGNLRDVWKAYNSESYITSIAAGDEFIYAADAMNKRILKYSADGELIMNFGKKDSVTSAPGFIIPSLYFDIAYGGFNDLWIVNPGRLRLENYSTSGYLKSSWGKASFEDNGFAGCCNPAHMALLPNGSFVTYEKGIDKIKVFDQAGRFVCMVAGAGRFKGNADFQLGNNNLVKDLATDDKGMIYILDAYNQVSIFEKKGI